MTKPISKYRDLSLAPVPGGTVVVAADSCASTGRKPGDTLSCDPYHCGRVSARVVLFELMCIGAQVLIVADGVCSEMKPTGSEIIRGFQDELTLAGLSPDCLTGSTEENFPTSMTGVGTAAVGYLSEPFVPPQCHPGDVVVCVGTPLVGLAFLDNTDAAIATYAHLKILLDEPDVRELVPVGSRGIAWETEIVAGLHHLHPRFDPACSLDLHQSGGPSTCVLAIMRPACFRRLSKQLPLQKVADLNAMY